MPNTILLLIFFLKNSESDSLLINLFKGFFLYVGLFGVYSCYHTGLMQITIFVICSPLPFKKDLLFICSLCKWLPWVMFILFSFNFHDQIFTIT